MRPPPSRESIQGALASDDPFSVNGARVTLLTMGVGHACSAVRHGTAFVQDHSGTLHVEWDDGAFFGVHRDLGDEWCMLRPPTEREKRKEKDRKLSEIADLLFSRDPPGNAMSPRCSL